MLPLIGYNQLQQKKGTVGIMNGRKRFRSAVVFSSLLWFLLLYLYVTTFAGFSSGVTVLANYAKNSNVSGESNELLLTVAREFEFNDSTVIKSPVKKIEEKPVDDSITTKNDSDPCLGRYIYVHDLPREFNEDILMNCHSLIKWFDMCQSIKNSGFGPSLDKSAERALSDNGWFVTNQFLLEVIFHNRMKHYECLTNDSSTASAVFVPFYAGLDVGRYLWDFNTSARDSTSLRLIKWLTSKPEWKLMWGRDHFLITGRISWDFSRPTENEADWGNKLMLLPATKNVTVLGIESSNKNGHEFSIPYPTYFHPSSDGEVFDWQNRMRRQRRPYLFSFAGAARPNMTGSIRGEIISQCEASRNKCNLLDCNPGGNKCDNPVNVLTMFQNSTFCMQPPGDSYTRRSTFDSILSGCIPVFFHPGSAYVQYLWHLPKNHTKYSVFIPERGVKERRVSIEKILMGIPKQQVLAMREEVVRLIPRVVYADPMARLETLEDAFDIAVKGVLERVEGFRKNEHLAVSESPAAGR